MVRLHEVARPRGAVGSAAPRCGVRKPGCAYAAARPRHDITFKYLSSAEKVLGGPGFAYVGEWHSDTGAVLEFQTEIDGIKLNGVDIITFADDGRITNFKVMVRPLKAINLLHRLMGEQLATAASGRGSVATATLK